MTRHPGRTRTRRFLPDTKEGAKGTKTRPPANITGVFSGLKEAWTVPGVLDWSMSYFFIKTVTYTILFWMPYYSSRSLSAAKRRRTTSPSSSTSR